MWLNVCLVFSTCIYWKDEMMSCNENVFCNRMDLLKSGGKHFSYDIVHFILTVMFEKLHSALRIFLLYVCICALKSLRLYDWFMLKLMMWLEWTGTEDKMCSRISIHFWLIISTLQYYSSQRNGSYLIVLTDLWRREVFWNFVWLCIQSIVTYFYLVLSLYKFYFKEMCNG